MALSRASDAGRGLPWANGVFRLMFRWHAERGLAVATIRDKRRRYRQPLAPAFGGAVSKGPPYVKPPCLHQHNQVRATARH